MYSTEQNQADSALSLIGQAGLTDLKNDVNRPGRKCQVRAADPEPNAWEKFCFVAERKSIRNFSLIDGSVESKTPVRS